jgi:hypothetical protein
LSATYLYQTKREFDNEYDDIRGNPVGHFVVICGYYARSDRFMTSLVINRSLSCDIPLPAKGSGE